jgi:hypothetical protein
MHKRKEYVRKRATPGRSTYHHWRWCESSDATPNTWQWDRVDPKQLTAHLFNNKKRQQIVLWGRERPALDERSPTHCMRLLIWTRPISGPHPHSHHNPITKQLLTQWRGEPTPRIYPLLSRLDLKPTLTTSSPPAPTNGYGGHLVLYHKSSCLPCVLKGIVFKFKDQYPYQQADTHKSSS